MPKQRGRSPAQEQSPQQEQGGGGAHVSASLSAFGFNVQADVELSPTAMDWLGGMGGNAAAAGLLEAVDPGKAAGRRIFEWLSGTSTPKREELVEVARTLPDDHNMLEMLNDLGARLANISDAVGEKAKERRRAENKNDAGGGGRGANKDGDDAPAGGGAEQAPAEDQEEQGGVQLSGAHWRSRANSMGWSNSTDFGDLDSSWGPKAEQFVEGLRDSGAKVTVNAGLRHPKRATLMHYAWKVANGQVTPAAATTACKSAGIQIEWDHGDLETSKTAAQGLVDAFGLVACASLTSNHIKGLAIDMTIENVPAEVTIAGKTYQTDQGAGGQADEDKVDHIGEELGVIWYGSGDWVHWSKTGG